ncbi:helix-turn-helix transcriptional regulator [Pseudoxanthomonas sp. J35]|uniref:helix-turn-helix domain-containing protein n=1 Tax=Pseudoxanthomonas sp. J35 TaxID=935852 RepID=UPI00048B8117|nr:helix-turn-helix transcriptional regulator [Pseudoxanthomonas sp. J35]
MRLDYQLPSAPLRSLVTVHAFVAEVQAPATEVLLAMLPNLHVRLAGHSRYGFGDAPARPAPRVALVGPTSEAYRIELEPGLEMLCLGLLPAGWNALLGAPAQDFADQLFDGAGLWGEQAVERLCDMLAADRDQATRIRTLERFLMLRMRPGAAAHPLAATDHWLEFSPDLSLDTLAASLDVGSRHLRRLTLEHYGASSKTLAMKYRALRVAASMASRGATAMEQALGLFADQAHLTRDFRRFVGWMPVAFMRQRQNVAAYTLAGRRQAGASRPLSLLS